MWFKITEKYSSYLNLALEKSKSMGCVVIFSLIQIQNHTLNWFLQMGYLHHYYGLLSVFSWGNGL